MKKKNALDRERQYFICDLEAKKRNSLVQFQQEQPGLRES
jgi:hypothetical protein